MKLISSTILAALVACGWSFWNRSTLMADDAQPAAASVDVGDPAPEFSATDDQGHAWKSEEHFGKKIVVVYFYPADLTGGCTKQACGFRDDTEKLEQAGVEVVGVSGDSVANHQVFKKAHNLPFALLADENGDVAAKFGVPFAKGEKTFKTTVDGEETSLIRLGTASRWTFVIGPDKTVVFKNTSVDAPKDSQKILDVVKNLK